MLNDKTGEKDSGQLMWSQIKKQKATPKFTFK